MSSYDSFTRHGQESPPTPPPSVPSLSSAEAMEATEGPSYQGHPAPPPAEDYSSPASASGSGSVASSMYDLRLGATHSGADPATLGFLNRLLRSTAAQATQRGNLHEYPPQAPPSSSSSAAVATPGAPPSPPDAAVRYLLAQRLAATVVADREERLAQEILLRDLHVLQERRRLRQQRLVQERSRPLPPASMYESYPPPLPLSSSSPPLQRPYPSQVRSELLPSLPSVESGERLEQYHHQDREAPLPALPLMERWQPSTLEGSSPEPAAAPSAVDDERAAMLEAAEACVALSHLGGRPPAAMTQEPPAEAVTEKDEAKPRQRIVSPGASPSPPPPSQSEQPVEQKKAKKKKTRKPKDTEVEADADIKNASGKLKKRKNADDGDKGEKRKRKGRKKENGMPRRPLSAYNIFFSEERERILNEIPDKDAAGGPHQESAAGSAARPINKGERVVLERRLSNPAHSRAVLGKTAERRKHRRTHGKIGFRDLARTIGQRWKALSDEQMKRYKGLAKIDMDRYQEELARYRRSKILSEVTSIEEVAALQAGGMAPPAQV